MKLLTTELEKKFEKSAFGYRSDEVDDYLQELSAAFDKLQNEKIQMERKLEVLAEKIEEYRADEDNMRAAILDARKLGSSIVKDAQRQADEIIADANAQSAKVIDSIQTRAEREKPPLITIASMSPDKTGASVPTLFAI